MGKSSQRLDHAGDKLLTPEEVADYLRIEVPTLHKWFRDGTMPVQRIQKGSWIRYRQSDIEQWLFVLTETPGGVDADLTIRDQPKAPLSAKEAADILKMES